MQIKDLPVSNSFSSSDVLAIEISGVTYKLTGATLAAALAGIGNYLTSIDLPLSIANGGTGATTAAAAMANLGIMNDWEQMSNVTWKQTSFITKIALYQNHTVYMQMTLASNNAASGDILAVLPTNARFRAYAPIVFADAATNSLNGSGLVFIETGSKNIIVSRATVPANSYMNISMVIPVE